MRKTTYSGLCALMVLLLQHSLQVTATCSSCACNSPSCTDPYSGSYQQACGSGSDSSLCSKYDECYKLECKNPEMTCHRDASDCQTQGGVNKPYLFTLLLAFPVFITTAPWL